MIRRTACDHDLHQAMVAMARASIQTCDWARAFVRHHMGSRPNDRKRFHAAVRALANKWLKVIHALLVRQATYDERVHVENLRRAGVPWAPQLEKAA